MNRFTQKRTIAPAEKTRQLKSWVQEILQLPTDVSISISQLQCHEPDCSPIETVISIMLQPVKTFKVHASIVDINRANLEQVLSSVETDDFH